MTPSILAAMPTWVGGVGIVVFLFICVFLILIVLIQRPQGGGLGGAFGGGAAGSGQTAFGSRTGDVLTWATIGIFVIFLTLGALLNFVVVPPAAAPPQFVPAGGASDQLPDAPATAPPVGDPFVLPPDDERTPPTPESTETPAPAEQTTPPAGSTPPASAEETGGGQ